MNLCAKNNLIAFLLGLCLCFNSFATTVTAAEPPYRLLLSIVIDQGGYETVYRYRPLYTGGLKFIMDQGANFSNMHHLHAIPVTAPGHASIASGVHPARSGIVENNWFDSEKAVGQYCVSDSWYSFSPKNLLVSTLGDWLKVTDKRSQVYSISGKDRGAILLGGKNADGAYWYNGKVGGFKTSGYYGFSANRTVKSFDARSLARSLFGSPWSFLLGDQSKAVKLGAWEPNLGSFSDPFPHSIGSGTVKLEDSFYDSLADTPFLDQLMTQFASHLIKLKDLGGDEHTDILFLSFSALDYIGHRYGPDSLEVADTLIRLDRELAGLFQLIESRNGLKTTLISLTADHGAHPFPEALVARGQPAIRELGEDRICLQSAYERIATQLPKIPTANLNWFLTSGYYNHALMEELGVTTQRMDALVKEAVISCRSIANVWFASDLRNLAIKSHPESEVDRFRAAFFDERSPDFLLQRKPFYLETPFFGTTHTSTYEHDSHVPWIVSGPGIKSAVHSKKAGTVDIAPTLAKLLGVTPPTSLDGVALNLF